jgi:RNA polymerase sigma factor (sigma-70 family)
MADLQPAAAPPVESARDPLAEDAAAAVAGNGAALERVLRNVQPLVARLALRFFGCPDHAADATQEVLLQIVEKLDRFAGESAFTTWVYRVATNRFLSMTRSRAERAVASLDAMERELAVVPDGDTAGWSGVERALLLEEVKVGCTLAMLLCLDRPSRLAYIFGAIAELDHQVAAAILGVTPATYRKRLQRARDSITALMRRRCGLFDERNACRCGKRVGVAVALGRVDPHALVFATSREQARRFPEVLRHIRSLDEVARAAALYRSHPDPAVRDDQLARVRELAAVTAGAELTGDR